MGDRFGTIDIGQKLGAVPFWEGELGPRVWPGLRPIIVPSGILIHPAVWLQQTWAEIGGCAIRGGAGSVFNTMLPGPRPTSVRSGI